MGDGEPHNVGHEGVHGLEQVSWQVGDVQELPPKWTDNGEQGLAQEHALVWVPAHQDDLPLQQDARQQPADVGRRQVEAECVQLAVARV